MHRVLSRALSAAVVGMPAAAFAAAGDSASLAPPPAALSPTEFRPLKVTRVEQLTADTRRVTLALPTESTELGGSTASCIVVRATVDGKEVVRPYTPTSPAHQRGSVDLVVKSYPKGKVSRHIGGVRVGDSLELKGPFTKFAYTANMHSAIGMVAAGTGIAPMYQLLLEILSNPRDTTEVRLVYASRTPADIILRDELDALAAVYPNFKVTYILSKPDDAWEGAKGHVSRELLVQHLPSPQAERVKLLVCGPPGFMKSVCGEKVSPTDQGALSGILKGMRFSEAEVFKF